MPFALIYEINTRCWLHDLSAVAGKPITLADVPDSEFSRWQRLGFTHIWLMGVWTTGPRARAISLREADIRAAGAKLLTQFSDDDVAGSPYAIAGYQVARTLGGESGLRAFRERLRQFELKLILDFVPNHVGLDHRWLTERPELFVSCNFAADGAFLQMTQSGPRWFAHGRDPYFPPWADTVQLDYRNPATRAAVIDELKRMPALCDGVRCDMAMLLLSDVFAETWRRFPSSHPPSPKEFWEEAISTVRAEHSDFLFIAEVYWDLQERLQTLGFEFTYYKELYDAVVRREHEWLQRRLHQAGSEFLGRCLHFLENHDEPRIASLLSHDEHRAAAVLLLALPGMRLLHDGQLSGACRRVPVHFTRRPADDADSDTAAFYEGLLLALQTTALGRGSMEVLRPFVVPGDPSAAAGVVAIQWQGKSEAFDLFLVNLGKSAVNAQIPPKVVGLAERSWRMTDVLTGTVTDHSGTVLDKHGVRVELPAHSAIVLHFLAR